MAKTSWKSLNRCRINFDDDFVIVFDSNDTEIYRGIEDYEPMKDAEWIWNEGEQCYKYTDPISREYFRKVCLDIGN